MSQYIITGNGRLIHTITSKMASANSYSLSLFSKNAYVPAKFISQSATGVFLTQNTMIFDYSFSDNFQVSGGMTLMQTKTFPTEIKYGLGPATVAFKVGNLEFLDRQVSIGALIHTSISVGDMTNIPYFPYYSGDAELGLSVYGSYYFDPQFADQSQSFHLNLGVLSHNEAKLEASRTIISYPLPARSVGVKYALGYSLPYGSWEFITETWGEGFMKEPDEIIYSRESYNYLNFGFKYRFDTWTLSTSADLLVYGRSDNTNYTTGALYGYPKLTTDDFNLSPYFFNVGVTLNLDNMINAYLDNDIPVYYYNKVPPDKYNEENRRDDIITQIIHENYRDLYECYKGTIRFDENLAGTIYVDFTVDEAGFISKSKLIISTFDSQFSFLVEDCMMEKIAKWKFPVGKTPIRFEILPLTFGNPKKPKSSK